MTEGLKDYIGDENYIMVEISTVDYDYRRMGIMESFRRKYVFNTLWKID